MALAVSAPAWADGVSGSIQDGYGRLSFSFSGTANPKVSATSTGGVLTISFSDKTAIDPASVVAALPRVLTSGRADADGKTLRFVLTAPVKLHVSQIPGRAVVDLAPSDFTGTMPDLVVPPKLVAKAGRCRLAARDQAAHRRLSEIHPPGVRLAQGCFLSGFSRRGKNDGEVRRRRCAWMCRPSRASRRPG